MNHESKFAEANSSPSVHNANNTINQAYSAADTKAVSSTVIGKHDHPDNKSSSHSVSWANPIETSSIPSLDSRRCDSSSGDNSSSFGSFSIPGDDDNNGDKGSGNDGNKQI